MPRKVRFPETPWELVGRAAKQDVSALQQLLLLYLPALRSYLRAAHRYDHFALEDVLQGFLQRSVLERQLLAKASHRRGRFRSLLVVALRNHLADVRRAERSRISRAGTPIPLEEADTAKTTIADQVDAFDLLWARQLIRLVLDRVREECAAADQVRYWQLFEARVLRPALESGEPIPYSSCIKELGFPSVADACNALVTVQRRLRRSLRKCIAEYVDQAGIEEEVVALRNVLAIQVHAIDYLSTGERG